MSKTDIWDRLGKTDPAHTKGFNRSGGFKGTAIKPIYTERKMTEEFGPCGVGWGFTEPQFQVVPGSEGQMAVYCWLTLWFVRDGERSAPVPGVGGDMVVVKQSAGLRTDDEAFKKAFTDAIGNAMKHIGMSADVHMGLFDDSKYVSERREEEAQSKPSKAAVRNDMKKFTDELRAAENKLRLKAAWDDIPWDRIPADWVKALTDEKDKALALLNAAARAAEPLGDMPPVVAVPPNFDNLETRQ